VREKSVRFCCQRTGHNSPFCPPLTPSPPPTLPCSRLETHPSHPPTPPRSRLETADGEEVEAPLADGDDYVMDAGDDAAFDEEEWV
jgi:hypothetical protein